MRRDIRRRENENKRIDEMFISKGKEELINLKPKLNDTQQKLLVKVFELIGFGQRSRASEVILEISKTIDEADTKEALERIASVYFSYD